MSDEPQVMHSCPNCERLAAEVSKLEAAPLCGDHAQVWYTARPSIKTECLWCDLAAEVERLRGELARMTQIADNCRADASRMGDRALRAEAALAPKVARHECENGVMRILGVDNDEIVMECPDCTKEPA